MMFVDPTRGRSKGYFTYALGAAAGLFFLGACDAPDQNTDLRPEGPPDVLAVLVMTDASAQLVESATYCRAGDDKRPTSVGLPDFTLTQICDDDPTKPADMAQAYPDGWYVRIMFDELLDPNIEELIEILDPDTGDGTDTYTGTIANTQPVLLECESVAGGYVEVPYDGYYSPAGNSVTWPLGPALVVKPDEPRAIATGKMCRITLRANITDKSGNAVPMDQRGPFSFQIAPITPLVIDPSDDPDSTTDDASPIDALQIYYDNVYVQFNTAIDETSICDEGAANDECEFEILKEDGICSTGGEFCVVGGAACPTVGDTCDHQGYYGYLISDTETGWGPNQPVQTDTAYTFQFKAGTTLRDRCGVETAFGTPAAGDNTLVRFKTKPFDFKTLVPGNGDTVSSLRKPTMAFNNVLDDTTLDATDYSISPAPASPAIGTTPASGGDFIFGGHYQPATTYTFTFFAGKSVTDAYGVTYTAPAEKKITYTTQPIAITSISPANNGTFTIAAATPTPLVGINFNQSMDPASLLAAEYTFTDSMGTAIPAAVTASGCTPTSTTCQLRVTPTPAMTILRPGTYTFTLKANATIVDVLGNVFTQPTDRTVTFDVANAPPPVVCL